MRRSGVVCAGEMLYDAFETHLLPGGAPANVAIALRRLGIESRFAGCLGTDAKGDALLTTLHDERVDTRSVQRSLLPTRVVEVTRDSTGDRTFHRFRGAKPNAFADTHFDKALLAADTFDGVAYLVVGSLELAYEKSRETMMSLIEKARGVNIQVVFDINRRPMFWMPEEAQYEHARASAVLQHAQIVKASGDEARWLFGTDDPAGIITMHPHLRAIVITGGAHAITFSIDGTVGTVTPPPIRVVDTTGAGDAFTAGLIAALLGNGTDERLVPAAVWDAVRFAAAVGTLATTSIGALSALPLRAKVDEFMREQLLVR
jgi:fructokinase